MLTADHRDGDEVKIRVSEDGETLDIQDNHEADPTAANRNAPEETKAMNEA